MTRFSLFCFVVLALAFVASAKTLHPRTVDLEGRIVGGSDANTNQFPYQVSLRSASGGHYCGGSIYSNRWIVTAAHCLYGQTINNVNVAVGTIYVNQGTLYRSSFAGYHGSYNPNTLANDIGLIQTATTISFSSAVQPITLGSAYEGANVAVVASGWGSTQTGGPAPQRLQYIGMRTITNQDCKQRTGSSSVHDSVICTLLPNGQGMCNGDSGGPLVANNQLVGAVSWGIPCARGLPDAFTRISSFRTWIIDNARSGVNILESNDIHQIQ